MNPANPVESPPPRLARVSTYAKRWGLTTEFVIASAKSQRMRLAVVTLGAKGIPHAPVSHLEALDRHFRMIAHA